MSVPLEAQAFDRRPTCGFQMRHAVDLLSQQIWCWGRDILRPEGNWLIELGFHRIEPPSDRRGCSSVYSVELGQGRCIVLRGFGVFYGDCDLGGVFLPRYEFRPKYMPNSKFESPPWSDADLPKLIPPTASQQNACNFLSLSLIRWIEAYERNIVNRLGIEYRQSMLVDWKNGKRSIIPANGMTQAWQQLGDAFAQEFGVTMLSLQPARSPSND